MIENRLFVIARLQDQVRDLDYEVKALKMENGRLRDQVQSAWAQRETINIEVARLRGLLGEVEYPCPSGDNDESEEPQCFFCGRTESRGHRPDCRLDAALDQRDAS